MCLFVKFQCFLRIPCVFFFKIKGNKVRLQTEDSKTNTALLRLNGEWEFKGGVVESTDYPYTLNVPFSRITYTLHLKVQNSLEVTGSNPLLFKKLET